MDTVCHRAGVMATDNNSVDPLARSWCYLLPVDDKVRRRVLPRQPGNQRFQLPGINRHRLTRSKLGPDEATWCSRRAASQIPKPSHTSTFTRLARLLAKT